jgi:hypothetical protein
MRSVHIIHWRPAEAGPLMETVRKGGFAVSCCEDARATAAALRASVPDIVAIDLSRLPGHGKEIAVWLRGRKATRHVRLVFVGGDPEKVAKLQQLLPDAAFTDLPHLISVLKAAPRQTTGPVTPPLMMQRYGNRTAAQKMGIGEGKTVAVMDAPRDYLTVLGEIPPGAEIVEDAGQVLDVTVWFVHEPDAFLAALPQMRTLAARTKLWVLWKKGSKNGITQNFIRETATGAGLVDYKICSVDGHWSGIAFARRKA